MPPKRLPYLRCAVALAILAGVGIAGCSPTSGPAKESVKVFSDHQFRPDDKPKRELGESAVEAGPAGCVTGVAAHYLLLPHI